MIKEIYKRDITVIMLAVLACVAAGCKLATLLELIFLVGKTILSQTLP